NQPQSEFGAKSAEGFDLDASQVDSSVGRHGASPIFEIRSGNKQPGSSSSEKSGIEQEQYDFNLITGEEIDSEIVSRVNDATDAALLTRRTNPTSEFAGAANRVLASELKHPGSTRKSMDLRLAGSLGDTFATLASDLEIGTLDARSRPGRGRNPNRDETLIAVSQVFVNKLLNHINGSISGVVSHLLENSADGDTYLPSLRKLASGVIQHKSKSDQDHISQEEVNELYAFLNLNEDLQPFLNNRPAKDIGINLSYIASRLVNELEKRDARKIEQVLDKLLPADGDINDRRLAKIFIRGERDDDVDFDIVNQLDKNDLAPPNGNARRWEELVNNIGTNMAERRVFGDDYSVTLLASPKIARLSIPSNIIKVRVDSDLEQGSSKRGYWLTTIGSMVALSTAVLVASANRSSSDVNSPEFRGAHDVIAKIDELSEKIDNKSSEQ
ncbi:MAG: hypothetical protein HOA17_09410, partial [Candidatus Melainabacteria bacterium]|nr:hypothetical protein [Candidatus Melainabacteria bacterium]